MVFELLKINRLSGKVLTMKCVARKFLAVAVASLMCGVLTTAQAAFISGSITFTGGAELNDALGSATAFSSFSGVSVLNGVGDYATLIGESADFTAFTFDPAPASPFTLWTLKAGQYTFTATGITDYSQTPTFLQIAGTGYAHVDGKDNTPGIWTILQTGGQGHTIQFGSDAQVPVPDGGMTVIMLSAALSGLGLLKKKLS